MEKDKDSINDEDEIAITKMRKGEKNNENIFFNYILFYKIKISKLENIYTIFNSRD